MEMQLVRNNYHDPGASRGRIERRCYFLFDVELLRIDGTDIKFKNIKNISLTSSRLILVNEDGNHNMVSPKIVDCLKMYKKNKEGE